MYDESTTPGSEIFRSGFSKLTGILLHWPHDIHLTIPFAVTVGFGFSFEGGRCVSFRNPLVSFVYERGWRNSFVWANFPGPDEEVITFGFDNILYNVNLGVLSFATGVFALGRPNCKFQLQTCSFSKSACTFQFNEMLDCIISRDQTC